MLSLKKVSFIAMGCMLGAFYVSAKEPVITVEKKAVKSSTVKAKFVQLMAKYDTDNNGLLSKAEAAKSHNKALLKNFDAIDENGDAGISEHELKSFNVITKVK